MPWSAVAAVLSRLSREGELRRVSKGVYYRSRPTSFGPSLPSASGVAAKSLHFALHPAGLTAANILGLTTQNPGRLEYATPAAWAPKALRNAIVHTGRDPLRAGLSTEEGAFLETLRERARSSDLSAEETTQKMLRFLAEECRFKRLTAAAKGEPPRVRAMLGALGEELGQPMQALESLRRSLNPLSRFDFGPLKALQHARDWQAK